MGHPAIAIDIAACRTLTESEADMEALIRELESTPPAAGFDEVLYPGEPEACHAAHGAVAGIGRPAATVADPNRHAGRVGVAELA